MCSVWYVRWWKSQLTRKYKSNLDPCRFVNYNKKKHHNTIHSRLWTLYKSTTQHGIAIWNVEKMGMKKMAHPSRAISFDVRICELVLNNKIEQLFSHRKYGRERHCCAFVDMYFGCGGRICTSFEIQVQCFKSSRSTRIGQHRKTLHSVWCRAKLQFTPFGFLSLVGKIWYDLHSKQHHQQQQ